jgi:hypothetical protein
MSPFSELVVPVAHNSIPREVIDRWILPIYNCPLARDWQRIVDSFSPCRTEITDELITMLLTDFNWRPRSVGAYLAFVRNRPTFTDHIGRLLLRSDVCYSGKAYCLALSRFNTPTARDYLGSYLDYYLTQKDLWFDQGAAMGAVAILDEKNSTTVLSSYVPKWQTFVANKPNWSLDRSLSAFRQDFDALHKIEQALA